MAKADYDKLFDEIDAETTRLGTEIEEVLAKLAAGGMTAEEEAAILARGNAAAARLKGLKIVDGAVTPPEEPPAEGEPGTGGGEGEPGTGGGEGERG